MELIDQQLAEYEALDIPCTKRPDFDAFWEKQVDLARRQPLNAKGDSIEHPFRGQVRDLTFEGLDGSVIRAWVLLPEQARATKVPAVVSYHGAGGSRLTPSAYGAFLAMGVAVVAMDFRNQGGLTGSLTGFPQGGNGEWFNWGVLDKEGFYFRHAWTDALRCIELAMATEEIDADRIAVEGGSQGGATSLAMAALHPAVKLCLADVPSNCWLEKRLFDRAGGMRDVATFLRQQPDMLAKACETLSYFDNLNLADRITCPVLVSVGLKDPVCPPLNAYAAYNKIRSEKQIIAYPFGEHDGGGTIHADRKLYFLAKHLLAEKS